MQAVFTEPRSIVRPLAIKARTLPNVNYKAFLLLFKNIQTSQFFVEEKCAVFWTDSERRCSSPWLCWQSDYLSIRLHEKVSMILLRQQ